MLLAHRLTRTAVQTSGTGLAVDVAPGWQPLLAELERRIQEVDPDAHLTSVSFDEHGVLKLHVTPLRPEIKPLLRECEADMLRRCELCGGTGRVHGGAVLTVRCDDCG